MKYCQQYSIERIHVVIDEHQDYILYCTLTKLEIQLVSRKFMMAMFLVDTNRDSSNCAIMHMAEK